PAIAHAWAETTGALWSSRTMMVRPLSSVVSFTPGGTEGMASLENGFVISDTCRTRRVFGNASGAIQIGARQASSNHGRTRMNTAQILVERTAIKHTISPVSKCV